MTTSGTTTEKQEPEIKNMVDALKMIKQAVNNKAGVPLSDYPVGQMLRLFNEGTKNIDGDTYGKIKDKIGQQGKDRLDMFGQDSLSRVDLTSEQYTRDMFGFIKDLNDDLIHAEGWDDFWKNEKTELQKIRKEEGKNIDDPAVDKEIDAEIIVMQNRVLSAYRFKVIQKVYLDNLNKPGSENLSTFNKFQQTLNGVILRSPPDSDLYAELEKSQKEVLGPYFVDEINLIIGKANDMRKNNASEDEIKAMIEKERGEAFERIAGARGGETYSTYFGKEKAREVFNNIFSVDNIDKRSKEYFSNSEKLTFDIDEELKTMIYISGAPGIIPDILSHDQKRVIEDYANALKGAGYFPMSKDNNEIFQQKTIEELKAKKAEVQKIYDEKKPQLQSFFAQKLQGLAQNGNIQEISLCQKIQTSFGGLEPQQKEEISSHLNQRLFKAIDEEDKKTLNGILPHVDLAQKNEAGQTPLQQAALDGKKDVVESLLKHGAKDTETTQYKRGFFTRLKDAFKGLTEGGLKGMWDGLTKNPPRTASGLAKMSGHDEIQGLIQQGVTPPTVVTQQQTEPTVEKPTPPPREPEARVTLSPQPIPQPPLGSGIRRDVLPPRPSNPGENMQQQALQEPLQTLKTRPMQPPPPTPDQPLSKHLESAIARYGKELTPKDAIELNQIVKTVKSLEARGQDEKIKSVIQGAIQDTRVSPEVKGIIQKTLLNKPLENRVTVGNVSTGIQERVQLFSQSNVTPLKPKPKGEPTSTSVENENQQQKTKKITPKPN